MTSPAIDFGDLRVFVYDQVVANGFPPTTVAIAEHFGADRNDAVRAIREVKIGKTILPDPRTGEIWMAGPFASVPGNYEVVGRDTTWWANCAWDMFGVAQIVGERVRVEARCPDCDAPISLDADANEEPADSQLVVHFLVPARRWYDDIGFT